MVKTIPWSSSYQSIWNVRLQLTIIQLLSSVPSNWVRMSSCAVSLKPESQLRTSLGGKATNCMTTPSGPRTMWSSMTWWSESLGGPTSTKNWPAEPLIVHYLSMRKPESGSTWNVSEWELFCCCFLASEDGPNKKCFLPLLKPKHANCWDSFSPWFSSMYTVYTTYLYAYLIRMLE